MPLKSRSGAALACLALAAPLLVSGCGGSDGGDGGGSTAAPASASTVDGVQQITIRTGDDLRFHPATISVHPGKVRVVLRNEGKGPPHDWQVPTFPAAFVPLAGAGQTREATFTAPAPGRYQFVCTIHERQGQIGTMTVTDR